MPQEISEATFPIPLPVRLQTLKIPVHWRLRKDADTGEPFFVPGEFGRAALSSSDPWTVPSFDPWDMRAEYQSLKEGDNQAAVRFLNKYGLFKKPDVFGALANVHSASPDHVEKLFDDVLYIEGPDGSCSYVHTGGVAALSVENFWSYRRMIINHLELPAAVQKYMRNDQIECAAHLVDANGRLEPSVVITLLSITDALDATIQIDRLCKAQFRKCLRPDCPVIFAVSPTNKRKIYHDYYCAHIEQVRDSRRPRKSRRKK
jgi:hypothetical protein